MNTLFTQDSRTLLSYRPYFTSYGVHGSLGNFGTMHRASVEKKMKRKPTPFASQKNEMRSLMNNYIMQTCLEVNADQQRQS